MTQFHSQAMKMRAETRNGRRAPIGWMNWEDGSLTGGMVRKLDAILLLDSRSLRCGTARCGRPAY
jgi:hypothetical protein